MPCIYMQEERGRSLGFNVISLINCKTRKVYALGISFFFWYQIFKAGYNKVRTT